MLPRLPHLYLQRQRPLWLLLCTLITLLVATTQIGSDRGATPDLLPLLIDVPVPEQVLFDDNFGAAMAIDGDIILVGAPLGLGEAFIIQRHQDGVGQWGKIQILDSGTTIDARDKDVLIYEFFHVVEYT